MASILRHNWPTYTYTHACNILLVYWCTHFFTSLVHNDIAILKLCTQNTIKTSPKPVVARRQPKTYDGRGGLAYLNFYTVGTWRWQGCQTYVPVAFTTPGNSPGTHLCQRQSQPHGHSAAGRIQLKKKCSIGNRTRDLLACSAVPPQNASPRPLPSPYFE